MYVVTSPLPANCGDPSPPSDGDLEPYTSTSEGAEVNRVHLCQNGRPDVEEIVCSLIENGNQSMAVLVHLVKLKRNY